VDVVVGENTRKKIGENCKCTGGAKTVKDGQFFLFDHLSSPIVVKGLLPTNNKH